MTVAGDITKADGLREKGSYEEALALYNSAISQDSRSFKAYVGKSMVYQKQQDYDGALGCLQRAKEIALARGKKELVDEVIYRLFTVMNNKSEVQEAVKYLNTHAERGHKDAKYDVWMHQLKNKALKRELVVDFNDKFASLNDIPIFNTKEAELESLEKVPKVEELKDEQPTIDIESEKKELEKKMANHDNLYPTPKNIRLDWFQSGETVTISMFLKNLPKDEKLKVKYLSEKIEIEFPTSSSSEFMYEIGPLFSKITPSKCSHGVFSTKLELYLAKATDVKWKKLERQENEEAAVGDVIKPSVDEGSALQYPNSSKKKTDWSNFKLEEDTEEATSGDSTDAFFKNLYKDADEDTRRAMMKSFVESNGTALSTNWGEVSSKKYETSPPDGMEAKDW